MKFLLQSKNFQFYIFSFLPFTLITGPFLADLSIVLISCIFLYVVIKEQRYYFLYSWFSKIFFLWYTLLLLSSFISSDPFFSLQSSLFYFRFGLFALAIWQILEDRQNNFKLFFYILLISFIILIFDGYLQFLSGYNIFGNPYLYEQRLSSLFGDEYILGKYLSYLFPLLFALIIKMDFQKNFFIYIFLILLCLTDIIIYLTGERTAFGLLVLSTVSIILFTEKWKLIRLISFCLSITLIIFLTFSNQSAKFRMVDHTLNQTQIISEDGTLNDLDEIIVFSDHHQTMYSKAYNIFLQNMVLGSGPKMYRKLCNDSKYGNSNELSCSTHPHNYYLQLLAEGGIIGILPIIFIFLYTSYYLLKKLSMKLIKKKIIINDYMTCLLICFLVILWPVIPSGNFFNNWLSILIYLPVGFFLFEVNQKKYNKF